MPDPIDQLCRPTPGLRVLVVAAHPDDETIGMGARLAQVGPGVTVLHVTTGSPADGRDARAQGFAKPILYEEARRAELEAAMSLAGVQAGQLLTLRRPDQRASFDLAGIVHALVEFVSDARPDVVVTHPYEGGHPDHDATAFAVAAACQLLRPGLPAPGGKPPGRSGHNRAPAHLEFTSYHNGPAGLAPAAFLPSDRPVRTLSLTPAECDLKRRMLACFATQRDTLQYFPVAVERFRVAPAYDFAKPPHAGTLFYEQFDWGLTGVQFRECAAAALAELTS